jgi:hypothetical protein
MAYMANHEDRLRAHTLGKLALKFFFLNHAANLKLVAMSTKRTKQKFSDAEKIS